ncbi:MAG: hypothetical protein WCK46_02945 [Candidatus Adlerbacteria bacterium]
MKKYIALVPLLALCMPFVASAHQHAMFTVGKSTYTFTIGSLNEPLVVDDKSGVDLTVTKGAGMATMSADGDMDGPAAASVPVSGLDQTLKVEISAGSQKKVLALAPQYGKPGAFAAAFYPTVATTLSYRFFGTVDGNAIDVTFTCLPEGATKAADDTTHHDVGGGVMQTMKSGGFGCPMNKESLGFPEPSTSIHSLAGDVGSARTYSYVAIALGVLALGLAVSRRKH